jgi:hypothetical protein
LYKNNNKNNNNNKLHLKFHNKNIHLSCTSDVAIYHTRHMKCHVVVVSLVVCTPSINQT